MPREAEDMFKRPGRAEGERRTSLFLALMITWAMEACPLPLGCVS